MADGGITRSRPSGNPWFGKSWNGLGRQPADERRTHPHGGDSAPTAVHDRRGPDAADLRCGGQNSSMTAGPMRQCFPPVSTMFSPSTSHSAGPAGPATGARAPRGEGSPSEGGGGVPPVVGSRRPARWCRPCQPGDQAVGGVACGTHGGTSLKERREASLTSGIDGGTARGHGDLSNEEEPAVGKAHLSGEPRMEGHLQLPGRVSEHRGPAGPAERRL